MQSLTTWQICDIDSINQSINRLFLGKSWIFTFTSSPVPRVCPGQSRSNLAWVWGAEWCTGPPPPPPPTRCTPAPALSWSPHRCQGHVALQTSCSSYITAKQVTAITTESEIKFQNSEPWTLISSIWYMISIMSCDSVFSEIIEGKIIHESLSHVNIQSFTILIWLKSQLLNQQYEYSVQARSVSRCKAINASCHSKWVYQSSCLNTKTIKLILF